jgi:hypothetical protein
MYLSTTYVDTIARGVLLCSKADTTNERPAGGRQPAQAASNNNTGKNTKRTDTMVNRNSNANFS